MRHLLRFLSLIVVIFLFSLTTHAQWVDDSKRIALTLLWQRKNQEAFKYVATFPGSEYATAYLGRQQPGESLKYLEDSGLLEQNPRLWLVKGDLLLALGRNSEALACYQSGAKRYTHLSDYPAEVEPALFERKWASLVLTEFPLSFTYGPGSHRDNWLIRRFLTLGAVADAKQEFERVWQIHEAWRQKSAYPPETLQFALDYAYFLKRNHFDLAAEKLLLDVFSGLAFSWLPSFNQDKGTAKYRLQTSPLGLGPKQFIHSAYTVLKSLGAAAKIKPVVLEAAKYDFPNVSIVAEILRIEGDPTSALNLELTDLDARVDSKAIQYYQRGVVLEENKELRRALKEYEMAGETLRQPSQSYLLTTSQLFYRYVLPENLPSRQQRLHFFQSRLLERRNRLAKRVGTPLQVLTAALAEAETFPDQFSGKAQMHDLEELFAKANRQVDFIPWARKFAANNPASPSLFWLGLRLGTQELGFQYLIKAAAEPWFSSENLKEWKSWLEQERVDWYPALVERLAQAYPQNGWVQLERLKLKGLLNSPQVIPVLELLTHNPRDSGRSNFWPQNNVFPTVFSAALALLKYYHQTGNEAQLLELALRIARRESPFHLPAHVVEDHGKFGLSEGNLVLEFAIQHLSRPEFLKQLQVALDDSPWLRPTSQIHNRLGLPPLWPFSPTSLPVQPTANGKGVALVSFAEVLSLCRDEQWMYVGHPWGVAVRDFQGSLVKTVFLPQPAEYLALLNGDLWVGTTDGLFRVDPQTVQVEHLRCDQELTPEDRKLSRTNPNSVFGLAVQNQWLWVQTSHSLRRYHPPDRTVRVFERDEMNLPLDRVPEKIMVDGNFLWVGGRSDGIRRFDASREKWESVPNEPLGRIQLLGIYQRKIWGKQINPDDETVRLVMIDPDTLQPGLVPVEPEFPDPVWFEVKELHVCGQLNGNPVFGSHLPLAWFDPQTGHLRPLQPLGSLKPLDFEPDVPFSIRNRWDEAGGVTRFEQWSNPEKNQPHARSWLMLHLPNGTLVAGGRKYPGDAASQTAGLWFWEAGKTSPRQIPNGLLGTSVFSVSYREADKTTWVCTSGGVLVLDAHYQPVRQFTEAVGLLPAAYGFGAWVGNRFICVTAGNSKMAFSVIDGTTYQVQTTKPCLVEGNPQIESIVPAATSNQIRVTFKPRWKKGFKYELEQYQPLEIGLDPVQSPPSLLLKTLPLKGSVLPPDPLPMPLLGGTQTGQVKILEKSCLFGTNGLLVVLENFSVTSSPVEMTATLESNQPLVKQMAESGTQLRPEELAAQFGRFLKSPNPFVVRETLFALKGEIQNENPEVLAAVVEQLGNSNWEVRNLVAALLGNQTHPIVIRGWQAAAQSPFEDIRNSSIIHRASAGTLAEPAELTRLYKTKFIPSVAGNAPLFEFLSKSDPAGLLDIYLQSPPKYSIEGKAFQELAKQLAAKPEMFLPRFFPVTEKRNLLERLAREAGTQLLPALHLLLTSPEPVTRANAALACGAIGERSSIPFLIQALDLQSQESQVAILAVLGTLKAAEAVPALVGLYRLRQKEKQFSEGIPANQRNPDKPPAPTVPQGVASFGEMDLEYELLQTPPRPRFPDFRQQNVHLPMEEIIKTIETIGPQAKQDFYQKLQNRPAS
ncbi:MAG: hypothetical protein K1Y36_08730 [Blastocatellia bacterium]|nr:hypothetical protein [Blastocatellia bacterium]